MADGDFVDDYAAQEGAQVAAEKKRSAQAALAKKSAALRKEKLKVVRAENVGALTEQLGITRKSAETMLVPRRGGTDIYVINEDNLGRVFAQQFSDALRFSHDRGNWFVWCGTHWKEDTTDLAFHWARELCRSMNLEGDKRWAKASTAAAVERYARADRVFAMTGDEWDKDPWLLATPAGTVNLETGELREADPADLITRCTLVAPEEGEPRLWRQFLAQVTQNDEELEQFLRQIGGIVTTGDIREECLFYFYGPGGSGKSTYSDALHNILADYATTAGMDTFLASKFEKHSTDIAMLRGRRLVVSTETQEGRSWDEAKVKALTGGSLVTARFMRADNFTFRPTFKLLLSGNHKPVLRTVDDAWRRRVHVIPFTYRPPKPDNTLKQRLKAEYGQILRWMIDGALDWQEHGMTVPERVRAETQDYFETQDQFALWLDERCETGPAFVESNTALFASWKAFCEFSNERPGSSRALSDRLAAHGFTRLKDEHGVRGRGKRGLRVKS